MVVFGQLVATIICGLFAEVDGGWRYMLGNFESFIISLFELPKIIKSIRLFLSWDSLTIKLFQKIFFVMYF